MVTASMPDLVITTGENFIEQARYFFIGQGRILAGKGRRKEC
jgi:hypothetical protein